MGRKKTPEPVKMTQRLEVRKISELIPYENNARTHPPEQIEKLRRSLREFGFVSPVLIDAAGNVIAGHGRLLAAEMEGFETAPCVIAEHLSDAQRRAYILADNRLAEMADWDDEILSGELQALQSAGVDLMLAGFENAEITIPNADPPEITEDDFDEEPPEEPVTRRGQVWQLGHHRLMCGDAASVGDVQTLMGGRHADLLFTDPPYGIGIVKAGSVDGASPNTLKGTIGASVVCPVNHYPPVIGDENTDAARCAYEACRPICEDAILFGGNYFSDFLPPSPCWIVWDKQTGDNNFADCELAWTSFNRHARLFTWMWNGMARKGDRATEGSRRCHPTQKPVGLFAKILCDFSKDDATVLDPFGGSGTTLIACEQTGRCCCMMEIDPHYCDVIIRRWEEFTGEKAVLLDE